MISDRKAVDALKEKYPKGTRILVKRMEDDPRPILSGTKGTVVEVDDIGTVHCDFDNGRRLGLVPGEDEFHRIEERAIDKTGVISARDLIRPMTREEHKYCYSQSSQLTIQTGAIGYLRADMDTDGYGFFSSWNGFQNDLNTQEFKDEFDRVINDLRAGKDNLLTDRSSLFRYCNSHPEATIGRNGYSGFRVDTEKNAYLLRVTPQKGEYNLYCYCYLKNRLNHHIEEARRGIRFIDSNYKDKFVLPDGEMIRITYRDGEHDDRICRYIDPTHAEIGSGALSLYHICEFAEIMESRGATVEPIVDTERTKKEKQMER